MAKGSVLLYTPKRYTCPKVRFAFIMLLKSKPINARNRIAKKNSAT